MNLADLILIQSDPLSPLLMAEPDVSPADRTRPATVPVEDMDTILCLVARAEITRIRPYPEP